MLRWCRRARIEEHVGKKTWGKWEQPSLVMTSFGSSHPNYYYTFFTSFSSRYPILTHLNKFTPFKEKFPFVATLRIKELSHLFKNDGTCEKFNVYIMLLCLIAQLFVYSSFHVHVISWVVDIQKCYLYLISFMVYFSECFWTCLFLLDFGKFLFQVLKINQIYDTPQGVIHQILWKKYWPINYTNCVCSFLLVIHLA